jgi:hypothetical protein
MDEKVSVTGVDKPTLKDRRGEFIEVRMRSSTGTVYTLSIDSKAAEFLMLELWHPTEQARRRRNRYRPPGTPEEQPPPWRPLTLVTDATVDYDGEPQRS